MAQVFHRSMNSVARITVFGLPLLFAGSVLGGTIIYRSGYITGEKETIDLTSLIGIFSSRAMIINATRPEFKFDFGAAK